MTTWMMRAALAIMLPALIAGCDMGLQEELNQKKEERFKLAGEKLAEIPAARYEAMQKALPPLDKKFEGKKHPLVLWRGALADNKDEEALIKLSEEYKGTPIAEMEQLGAHTPQQPAIDAAAFAKESAGFWKEMMEKGRGGMERYTNFLKGYIQAAEDVKAVAEKEKNERFVQRPFVGEAAFEIIFLHAVRFYQLEKLSPSARWTTAYPYWQLAFDYPSIGRESFSNYVTRLCRGSKIAERCKGVPHEVRPFAINKPYLEFLQAEIDAWLKTYGGDESLAVFKTVLEDFKKRVDAEMKETPDLTEDPVLPSTYADRAAATGFRMIASKREGLKLHETQLLETWEGKLPGNLAAKAKEIITALKEDPSNTVDYERVVVEVPGDLSANDFVRIIRSFPNDLVRQFDLIGRRRVDESLRRTGTLLRLPAPDEPPTTSYFWKGGEENKTYCEYLGIMGRPPIGRKSPGHYLVIDDETIKSAKLVRDPETRELSVEDIDLNIKVGERDKMIEWLDKHPGIIRLFLTTKGRTYSDALEWISQILNTCQDQILTLDERGEQKVTIKCAKSEDRDITLVLGMCR